MKRNRLLRAIFLLFLVAGQSRATDLLDSISGTTVAVTVARASAIVIRVDYPEGTLAEILAFLNRKAAGFTIETAEKAFPGATTVRLTKDGISLLDAAALLADQIQADVLIRPGRILLVPKPNPALLDSVCSQRERP